MVREGRDEEGCSSGGNETYNNVMVYKYVVYISWRFFSKSGRYGLARFWQYLVQV